MWISPTTHTRVADGAAQVLSGSQERIDLAFRPAATANDADATATAPFTSRARVSYEELQRYIEQVLEATGYYSCSLQPTAEDEDMLEAPPGPERGASMPSMAAPLAAAPSAAALLERGLSQPQPLLADQQGGSLRLRACQPSFPRGGVACTPTNTVARFPATGTPLPPVRSTSVMPPIPSCD